MDIQVKGFRSKTIAGKWVVTIGNFDGYHLGHQALVNQVLTDRDRLGVKGGVLTFDPHPKILLQPNVPFRNIYDDQSKWKSFEETGLDACILISFTSDFARLSPSDFVEDLFNTLDIVKIIVGYDFNFGKSREGSATLMKEEALKRGIEFEHLDPVKINQLTVSSTMIRRLIFEGEFEVVQEFLGRTWAISGTVVKGNQLGRTIGFPTLNLEPRISLPIKEGVYAVDVKFKDRYLQGISNMGYRPTLQGQRFRVETYVFDLDEEIYGETISVYPREFVRDEMKFDSLDELKAQIKKDVQYTKGRLLK
ncbi:MAG: bifunctional riboflavin kinase/FAD synthetase [Proteobacteria bacterium]|nr:bifunctional riboflavin kinase/FAD synthetase [Pseudomonadota bacterium]